MDGVIDRLVLDGERVIAVDFKSNAFVPDRAEEIPLGILRQLAAYREVLCQIYPQKEVVTGILWTSEARFMSVPHKLVIAALAGVASS